MRKEQKWEPAESGWDGIPWETAQRARIGWHLEFDRELRTLLENERATRRFLADEVYRVPDALLDDVIRVRLADLSA